jgi:hypothetical protein
MKQEIKDLWINALESGQYTKTTDILHDATNNAHCANGVLCDLAYDAGVVTRRRVRDPWAQDRDMYVYGEDQVFGVLPIEVREWAGLDACDPELGNGDTISEVNDNTTTEHADMAVLIKEYL